MFSLCLAVCHTPNPPKATVVCFLLVITFLLFAVNAITLVLIYHTVPFVSENREENALFLYLTNSRLRHFCL